MSVLSRCWDLESAWSLISLISVLGPRFCLEFRIVDIGAWTTSLPGVCDETLDPLLDQGLVEASGSFALLTFALER